jgi:hypothetical protein
LDGGLKRTVQQRAVPYDAEALLYGIDVRHIQTVVVQIAFPFNVALVQSSTSTLT